MSDRGCLAASRARLNGFEKAPSRHARHAARALVMFHMMEHVMRDRAELEAWLPQTPIFQHCARLSDAHLPPDRWARELVAQLVGDGLLRDDDGALTLAPPSTQSESTSASAGMARRAWVSSSRRIWKSDMVKPWCGKG